MLKDMRISDMEKKNNTLLSVVDDKPNYPYSLKLMLDSDTVAKLGLADLPDVGEKMQMLAVVEVVGVRKEGEVGDVGKYCLDLQIQQMDIKESEKDESVSGMLYGG